jgi:glycosyltransferase involved in cell wall biosynthesis
MLELETHIAVVLTTCLQVPPDGYGGLELMVYNPCAEPADRGYDVTCIAPEGTDIDGADVIETTPPDDSRNCFRREPDACEAYADRLSGFDLVIDHSRQKLPYARKQRHPEEMTDTGILGVWHGMPEFDPRPIDEPDFVSVGQAAAAGWSQSLDFEVRHVYNGIDLSEYDLRLKTGDYAMTFNRVMPEKGIIECIDIAEALEVPLKVVGEDKFVDDPGYVVEVMRRCGRSPYAEYIGQVDEEQKAELLAAA